ncbi:MAG: clostripain-related cysteine peptidase [Planctomycetota bacterium]
MGERRLLLILICCLKVAAVLIFILPATSGCNRDRDPAMIPEASPSMYTTRDQGLDSTDFAPYETPLLWLQGLSPYTAYHVEVFHVDALIPETIVGRYTFTTDETGAVPPTQIAYDLDPGSYRITLPQIPLESFFHVAATNAPCCYVCNAAGQHTSVFSHHDPVHITGFHLPPGLATAFIVDDRKDWVAGELLFDRSGAPESITIPADGYLPPTLIWPCASGAQRIDFDVVLDMDADGKYSEPDLLDAQAGTGFVVQKAPDPESRNSLHRIEQLASDRHGLYKDQYSIEEDLYLWLNPATGIENLNADRCVDWMIVPLKETWNDQDLLEPVAPVTTDTLQQGCTNAGLRRVWAAPLTEGKFTVVLDTDRDGLYDQGLDILDGCSSPGTLAGFEVIEPQETREWTVLIFADGDGTENPLHESRFAYLEEIRLALQVPSRVHAAMFFDGAEGYTPSDAGYYTITSSEWACVKNLGEVCCGEPQVLRDFLLWGITRFPAHHYLVAISNHGGAWFEAGLPVPVEIDPFTRAIAYDQGDALNMYELEEVYRTLRTLTGQKLDIIWYQACLMGCVETASSSEPYFDYMAAHETVRLSSENPGKWARIIEFIEAGNDAEAIAKQITTAAPLAGLSCAVTYDLNRLALLQEQIKRFCGATLALEGTFDTEVIKKIQATRSLDITGYPPLNPPLDQQRDLLDFFACLSRSSEPVFPSEIRDSADAVLNSAVEVIIARQSDEPDFTGMSGWLPDRFAMLDDYRREYARLSFERNTGWAGFLHALHD